MWHTKRSETFPNARAYSHQIKAIDLESAQRRGRPLAKQLRLAAAALTDVGRRRERNQDNVTEYIPPEQDELNQKGALFVVCDGMGGHAAGEIASEIGVNTIRDVYFSSHDENVISAIARAVKAANEKIYANAREHPEHSGMGTTCVALIINGGRAYIVNIGDSRAYIARDGKVRQVTQDHSWVAEQVRMGMLTEDQARVHAHRNVITRSLGTQPTITADLFVETLHDGDRIVLCSDGLHGYVDEQAMIRDIVAQNTPQMTAQTLLDMANENGGPDNISVIVVDVLEAPEVVGPVPLPPSVDEPIEEGTTQPLPALPDPKKVAADGKARQGSKGAKTVRKRRSAAALATRIGLIAALLAIVVGVWYFTLGPLGQQRAADQQTQADIGQAQTAITQAQHEDPGAALATLAAARQRLINDIANPALDAQHRQQAQNLLDSQLVPAVQTALQRYNQSALITPVQTSAAHTYALTCGQTAISSITALAPVARPGGKQGAAFANDQFVFIVSAGDLYQALVPLDANSQPTGGSASCVIAPLKGYAQVITVIPGGAVAYAIAQESNGKYDVLSLAPQGFNTNHSANVKITVRQPLPLGSQTPTHLATQGSNTYVSFTNGSGSTPSNGLWYFLDDRSTPPTTPTKTISLPQPVAALTATNGTAYLALTDGTVGQVIGQRLYQPLAVNVPDPALLTDPNSYTSATPIPTPSLVAVTPEPTATATTPPTATPNPSATATPTTGAGATTTPTLPPTVPPTVVPVTGGTSFLGDVTLVVDPAQPTYVLMENGAKSRVVVFTTSTSGPGMTLHVQYVYGAPLSKVSQLGLVSFKGETTAYVWSNGQLATFPLPQASLG